MFLIRHFFFPRGCLKQVSFIGTDIISYFFPLFIGGWMMVGGGENRSKSRKS